MHYHITKDPADEHITPTHHLRVLRAHTGKHSSHVGELRMHGCMALPPSTGRRTFCVIRFGAIIGMRGDVLLEQLEPLGNHA